MKRLEKIFNKDNFTTFELQKEWEEKGFNYKEYKDWTEVGLKINDFDYAKWLRDELELTPKSFEDNEILREQYQKFLESKKQSEINAQEYINNLYSTWEDKISCQELIIPKKSKNCPQGVEETLEGSLSLKGFINLKKLDCRDHKITELKDLDDCAKLEVLYCTRNKLTSLDLNGLTQLEELTCNDNYLTNLNYSVLNPNKLSFFAAHNNNLNFQDLSAFSRFIDLTYLWIGNDDKEKIQKGIYNRFYGSLEPLKNLTELVNLHISNTDISEGVEYLPKSVKDVKCSTKERPESKLRQIESEISNFFANQFESIFTQLGLNDSILGEVKEILKKPKEELFNQLNERVKKEENKDYGVCEKCSKPRTGIAWCQFCSPKSYKGTFSSWTSGNTVVDECLQGSQLEATDASKLSVWISYNQFRDIEYLDEGGFGKVYKAKTDAGMVALKVLDGSQKETTKLLEFLQEIKNHNSLGGKNIVMCYGISRDPMTKNYIMVMDYIEGGNLRKYLKNNHNKLSFENRLRLLESISQGLRQVHERNLIHKDFHPGNILIGKFKDELNVFSNFFFNFDDRCHVADLGLCHPVSEEDQGKIYGVLPYVAPEVVREKKYTQAADIYSWGMIVYELFSGLTPYQSSLYNAILFEKIKQGLRPDLDNVKAPQLLKDLIKRCWDADPLKRPTATEILQTVSMWQNETMSKIRVNTNFYRQVRELEKSKALVYTTSYQGYSQHFHTSRLLDFKDSSDLQGFQKFKEVDKYFHTSQEIEQVKEKINLITKSLNNESKGLVDEFIVIKKQSLKDKENEELENSVWGLEDKLEEKGIAKEKVDEIIRYCERLFELEQQLEQERLEANVEISTNK